MALTVSSLISPSLDLYAGCPRCGAGVLAPHYFRQNCACIESVCAHVTFLCGVAAERVCFVVIRVVTCVCCCPCQVHDREPLAWGRLARPGLLRAGSWTHPDGVSAPHRHPPTPRPGLVLPFRAPAPAILWPNRSVLGQPHWPSSAPREQRRRHCGSSLDIPCSCPARRCTATITASATSTSCYRRDPMDPAGDVRQVAQTARGCVNDRAVVGCP